MNPGYLCSGVGRLGTGHEHAMIGARIPGCFSFGFRMVMFQRYGLYSKSESHAPPPQVRPRSAQDNLS